MHKVQFPISGRGTSHRDFSTIVDLWSNARAASADRVAIEDEFGALTYETIWNAAHAVAVMLIERGCVGRTVAILLPNGADFHVAYLGALLARAIPAPINPSYPPLQVEVLLKIADARLVFVAAPSDLRLHQAIIRSTSTEVIEFQRQSWLRSSHDSIHCRSLVWKIPPYSCSPAAQPAHQKGLCIRTAQWRTPFALWNSYGQRG